MRQLGKIALVFVMVLTFAPAASAGDRTAQEHWVSAAKGFQSPGVATPGMRAAKLGFRESKRRLHPTTALSAAESPEPTSTVVVGFEPSVEARVAKAATRLGARISRRSKTGGFYVLKVPADSDVAEFMNRLQSEPGVSYVEPDGLVHMAMASNDPGFSSQWGATRIGAPSAWDVTRGSSIKVAVIDTGVHLTHADLVGRLDTVNDYDFVNGDSEAQDDQGHGTHVAGIIGATLNNGIGVAGIANQATILPVKVLAADGTGTSSNVADGIRWAADKGAKVINLSLGSNTYSSVIESAVQYATALDCVVVAATGNEAAYGVYYPARLANVVAVGSTTPSDARSTFSNYGPQVDICAPGSDIYSTLNTGGYGTKSGTSMATPHVAGVVALIRAKNPAWSRSEVESQLQASAIDLGATGKDNYYGWGRVRAAEAVGTTVQLPPTVADDDIPGVMAPVSPIIGTLDGASDIDDVYRVHLDAGQTLMASLQGSAGTDFDLYLYGPTAGSVLVDSPIAGSDGASYPEMFQFTAPSAGDYYLDAYAYDGSGSYSIAYSVSSADAEPDDDIPGVAAPSSPILGSVDSMTDTDDVYAINLTAGQSLTVNLNGASGTDFDAYLFGPGAESVHLDDPVAWAMSIAYPDTFTYVATSSGLHYVDVNAYSGAGAYSLTYGIESGGSPDIDGDVPGVAFTANPQTDTLDSLTDRADVYSLSLEKGQRITLTLQGSSESDFNLYLFGPGATSIYQDTPALTSAGTTYPEQFTFQVTQAGTYYVACYAFVGSGTYALHQEVLTQPTLGISAPSTISYGSTARITGRLLQLGNAIADEPVMLYKKAYGATAWSYVALDSTDADGAYGFSQRLASKTSYQVRYTGDGPFLDATSATKSVKPRVALTNPRAPSTMSRSRYYTVYGYLKPRHSSGTYPVRIYKWKKTSSGSWKSYGYSRAKASTYSSSMSRYARSIRLSSPGKWRLRAYALSDSRHAGTWSSGYDYVTVK